MTSNPRLNTVGYNPGCTLCILDAQPRFGVGEQFYIVDDISKVQMRLSPIFLNGVHMQFSRFTLPSVTLGLSIL